MRRSCGPLGSLVEALEPRRLFVAAVSEITTTGQVRFISSDFDEAGNLYVVGDFSGTTDFSEDTKDLTAVGASDMFLMRIAATTGAVTLRRWASGSAPEGVPQVISPTGVLVFDGHVFITGGFTGHVDLDPTKGTQFVDSKGSIDGFLLSLDAAKLGFDWGVGFGGTSEDTPRALDVDSAGNPWVAGNFKGTIEFPGTPYKYTSAGGYDGFFGRFDDEGMYGFGARIGGQGNDAFLDVAIDSKDNATFVGQFEKTIDSNPGSARKNLVAPTGFTAGMLLEVSGLGSFRASRSWAGTNNVSLNDVVYDDADNLYVTGHFKGTMDADSGSGVVNLTSKGDQDIFFTKLDAKLTYKFNHGIGGAGKDDAFELEQQGQQILITGKLVERVDLDPSKGRALFSALGIDPFLAAYTVGGKYLGAAQVPAENGVSVSVAQSADNWYLMANYTGKAEKKANHVPTVGQLLDFVDSGARPQSLIIQVTPKILYDWDE